MLSTISHKNLHAATGNTLSCKGWVQEAALRMLHNNLDPAVAERPDDLIVYGGTGKAARNWESFDLIVKALRDLNDDETLLVQSGKPVGILPTHKDAPRVIIANSNLVGHWANWDYFRELEKKGLIMYGQMTAGSWIYIGSQGIVQGTYETYLSLAAKHYNSSLKGTLNVTAGLGGMGGAQPLAITMNEGVCLAAEMEQWRIEKRIETRYLDKWSNNIDEAIDWALEAKANGEAVSIAVCCNVVDLLQRLIDRNITPDTLTDQTSAHDELVGYFPEGLSVEQAKILREQNPEDYKNRSLDTMCKHVKQMIELQNRGAITFDYGNNLRGQAFARGVENAFAFPGFVIAHAILLYDFYRTHKNKPLLLQNGYFFVVNFCLLLISAFV